MLLAAGGSGKAAAPFLQSTAGPPFTFATWPWRGQRGSLSLASTNPHRSIPAAPACAAARTPHSVLQRSRVSACVSVCGRPRWRGRRPYLPHPPGGSSEQGPDFRPQTGSSFLRGNGELPQTADQAPSVCRDPCLLLSGDREGQDMVPLLRGQQGDGEDKPLPTHPRLHPPCSLPRGPQFCLCPAKTLNTPSSLAARGGMCPILATKMYTGVFGKSPLFFFSFLFFSPFS